MSFTFLYQLAYLIGIPLIGIYLYNLSGALKKVSNMSMKDLNEDEPETEQLNEKETNLIRKISRVVFIMIGVLLWSFIGITVGRIAANLTNHSILKWVVYIFAYFIFLRIPFGASNKMLQRIYEFEEIPEKVLFAIFMIASYILSICCYEYIPGLFTWHLGFIE